jgi:hypothetical protein
MIIVVMVIDIGFIAVEYSLSHYPKQYSQLWIFSNVLVNIALGLLIFVPIIMLTFVLVSVTVALVIIAEGRIHYL